MIPECPVRSHLFFLPPEAPFSPRSRTRQPGRSCDSCGAADTGVALSLTGEDWAPPPPPHPTALIGRSPLTPSLSLCRMRELKQNQELEGLPQPGLAT